MTVQRATWAALVAVLVVVLLMGLRTLAPESWSLGTLLGRDADLPVLGTVPDFQLTERSGRVVRRQDLRGRIWVADFIFTRCSGTCPSLSTGLAGLQRRLGIDGSQDVRLVSFTVDPANDTPEVLRAYAERYGASVKGWLFLTGDRGTLYDLIGKGFHLSVAQREIDGEEDPNQLITHSDRLVLVDRRFRIRGYYRGTEPDQVERLVHDLAALQRQS